VSRAVAGYEVQRHSLTPDSHPADLDGRGCLRRVVQLVDDEVPTVVVRVAVIRAQVLDADFLIRRYDRVDDALATVFVAGILVARAARALGVLLGGRQARGTRVCRNGIRLGFGDRLDVGLGGDGVYFGGRIGLGITRLNVFCVVSGRGGFGACGHRGPLGGDRDRRAAEP
jgi:hypothetical protein